MKKMRNLKDLHRGMIDKKEVKKEEEVKAKVEVETSNISTSSSKLVIMVANKNLTEFERFGCCNNDIISFKTFYQHAFSSWASLSLN